MSNVHVLYVGNDSVLQVDNLKDEIGGEYLAGATVVVSLADEEGNAVLGAVWPQSLVYMAGTTGIYRTTLPYTLEVIAGRRYVATVVADAGPGLHAEWEIECVARMRN